MTPPHFPLDATPFGRASKRGLRGLGSGRLSAYMQLSCPEFRLRGLPRITVRGQTVQGGRVLLRKAPLPSRVYSWSTRRPCGPLAFRCATEGSRSAKEGKGSQEGTGNHMVSCPLLPLSVGTDTPGRRRRPKNALDGAYPRLLHQRCRNRRNREPVLPDRRKYACAWQKNPSDKTKSID